MNPQTYNRYSYVNNRPIIMHDPSGHNGCTFGYLACTDAGPITPAGQTPEMQEALKVAGNASGKVALAVACELCDWGMTLKAWSKGDFSPFDLLGLLPIIPGAAARTTDDVADAARYAENAQDGARGICAFNSFEAGTMVETLDGPKPIEEIAIGDLVLAYNEATGEIRYYPVTGLISHLDLQVVYLTIDGETIVTTAEHPFYTANGEWVDAGELKAGDAIRTSDWTTGEVTWVQTVAQPQQMYNFTVATAHTYFVGDGEWLVHNIDCNPLEGLPRVGSATKEDVLHAFPDIVDNYVVDAEYFSLASGTDLYQIEGAYSYYSKAGDLITEDGIFEWIVHNDQVTHRVFIPGGSVSGILNQWPKK